MAQARKRRQPTTVQTATSGTVIRIEQPKSKRTQKPVAQVVVQELNPAKGFVGFLREHAIVGLAVGFAIGTQAQQLIKDLITSFIDPLFNLLFGESLVKRTFTWHFRGRHENFQWGLFVHSLASFLFVLLVIYLILRSFNLDEFDRPKKKS
ncbi:MAG TPA: MscL family protein [Candidatus Saccharimonadales bacterium]|nr:MscL family protein [Candidatus Saccharimonadales bacterium]